MVSMHSSPMGELGTRDTGGMSVYVGEVSRRLAENGCAVDIFTRLQHSKSVEMMEPFPNVRVIHLAAGPPAPLPHLVLYHLLPKFFENLEAFRTTQGIHYDLVHSHYYLSGQIGQWARKRWLVPHVSMFHTLGLLKNRIAGSEKEPELRVTLERYLAAKCDCILAGTAREKRHLIDLYGVLPQKIQVVPCGVDRDRFHPGDKGEARARLGLNGTARVILYVGRFDPIKGVDRLLEAAHRLRPHLNLRVVLVGGGGDRAPEDEALRSKCRKLSMEDCVSFAGRKNHDELADYYRAADVLVLPSHYESFGLVVLEALACGLPVVAMRVGVVEDVIRNGLNGWIVEDNSAESLAEGMRRVFEGQGAPWKTVDMIGATVEDYDWRVVADAIHDRYQLLTGRADGHDNLRLAGCHCVSGQGALS
ncbi:MAG TPA: glycosyltransferase family 1 protein [Syntrophobacteraceae bacterium]|nr:glycosyltransferase family 1 protein [Syntrophobacteraceae bacterium]